MGLGAAERRAASSREAASVDAEMAAVMAGIAARVEGNNRVPVSRHFDKVEHCGFTVER